MANQLIKWVDTPSFTVQLRYDDQTNQVNGARAVNNSEQSIQVTVETPSGQVRSIMFAPQQTRTVAMSSGPTFDVGEEGELSLAYQVSVKQVE